MGSNGLIPKWRIAIGCDVRKHPFLAHDDTSLGAQKKERTIIKINTNKQAYRMLEYHTRIPLRPT